MTQSAREYLVGEVGRLAKSARDITSKAEGENRPMSDEERGVVENAMANIGTLKARITEMDDRDALKKAIDDASVPGGTPTDAPTEPKSLGEAFVKSEGYRGLKNRGMSGRWSTGPVEFGTKLDDGGSPALDVSSITGANGAYPLNPQVAPMVPPVEQRLTITALFGQGTATQNTIVYLEETSTTQGALSGSDPYNDPNLPATAVLTSEGALKPAAFIDFTKRSVAIDKIAAFLPVSDEMVEDEPQISSYINGRLSIFVRQAEEAYLLAKLLAAGIGTADSSDIGGDNLFDAIAAGIRKVQVSGGMEPDSVVINPTDFWTMAVTKASGGTGQYFSGGPYAGPNRNPWGLNAVVTSAVAAGSPIVGAFKDGATVWRKGGLSVEASNSHADYFRRNLTALRAEERLGLAVYRPSAFATCTV